MTRTTSLLLSPPAASPCTPVASSCAPSKHSRPVQPALASGWVMCLMWTVCAAALCGVDALAAGSVDAPALIPRVVAGMFAVGVALQFSALTRFYGWFRTSGLWLASRRGMGSRGHPVYGLFHPPALSMSAFVVVGDTMLFSLILVAAGLVSPSGSRVVLGLAFCCSILFYSQLFAETTAGQHSALVLPHVLLYLALAGDDMALCLWLIKWHLVSLYCGAGLSKLGGSLVGGHVWALGHTLRASTYHALWSRPGATSSSLITRMQAFICTAPQWLLALAATQALLFEVLAPVMAVFYPAVLAWVAFGFHVGVFALLGIDFLTYWCPALMVFLLSPTTTSCTLSALSSLPSLATVMAVPAPHVLALVYFGCQWFFTLTLNEARGGSGPMPFSCSPMFAMPQHLTRSDMVNHLTAVPDGDGRASGFLGTVEWSGPWFESHTLSEKDLAALPWRVSYMTSTACRFNSVSNCVKPEHRQTSHCFITNITPRPGEDPNAVGAYVAALRRFAETSVVCGPRDINLTTAEEMQAVRDAVDARLHILDLRNAALVM